jgi:hypothetical protein
MSPKFRKNPSKLWGQSRSSRGVEAEVPGLARIQAHGLLEILSGQHRVVGDPGVGRRAVQPRPLGQSPDVHPADVGGRHRIVGILKVGGLQGDQDIGDVPVLPVVQRLPEETVRLQRQGRALADLSGRLGELAQAVTANVYLGLGPRSTR